jgi:uncharacterized protein with ParB-like and HNH nuclease domain
MDTTATNKKLREIISEISQNTLVLRPGFQRNLVWTSKHKNNIIRTVLKGYPFPEIFIATMDCDMATAASNNGIVDGQQRISMLFMLVHFINKKYHDEISADEEFCTLLNSSFEEYSSFVANDYSLIGFDSARYNKVLDSYWN